MIRCLGITITLHERYPREEILRAAANPIRTMGSDHAANFAAKCLWSLVPGGGPTGYPREETLLLV